ncbi:MAG TPA: hypothetical protein VHO25_01495 [Polyangiaceae bacterium]|nr:hypothetical protein [Polyangiaceae bacterium]
MTIGGLPLVGCDNGAPTAVSGEGEGAVAIDAATSCVGATGGGPEPWWDAEISGRQFDAYDGERMRVVISGAGRLGVGEGTVVQGSFAVAVPGAINHTAYTEIALYVDRDDDDACDDGEALWGFVTGSVRDDLGVEVTPDEACVSGGGDQVGVGCRPWLAPAGPCFVNGQTDLQTRLPCSP